MRYSPGFVNGMEGSSHNEMGVPPELAFWGPSPPLRGEWIKGLYLLGDQIFLPQFFKIDGASENGAIATGGILLLREDNFC